LDQKNSGLVFDKFKELCSSQNLTLLIVTHDPEFAKKTDRIIEMEDGKVVIP
jgi:lipoprotein-releasing system ATP-binding protein